MASAPRPPAPALRPATRRCSVLVAALLALLLWAAIGAGGARAASSVCGGTGAAAGECNDPRGVATDFETGRVYVAERGNDRISVFSAEGDFEFAFGWEVNAEEPKPELQKCTAASGCRAATAGSKAGQLLNPTNIAIDNSGGSGQGDVYLTTSDFRVSRFDAEGDFVNAFGWGVDAEEPKVEAQSCDEVTGCLAGIQGTGECQLARSGDPVAAGPEGDVYVLDSFGTSGHFTDRVIAFSPAGECLGETVVASEVGFGFALAIDSGGDAWVGLEGVSERLRHYELGSDEAPLCFVEETIQPNSLSLDDEDRLFAAQFEPRAAGGGSHRAITEYDSACQAQHRFGYGETSSPGGATGLAVAHGVEGEPLFVSEGTGFGFDGILSSLTIPPLGPLIAPDSLEADPHSVWAQIDAEANPEGRATGYRVEYVKKATYEAEGFEGPETKTSGEGGLEGEGFSIAAIQTAAGCNPFSQAALEAGQCLQPETAYAFRVVVENSDGEAAQTGEFQTLAPLEIEATFATQVGTDGGRLEAVADPHGSPATGYFEYVSQQDFEESGFAKATRLPDTEAGEAPLDFGSGEAGVRRAATLTGLPEGAAYRYRVVLSDPFGSFEGPVRSFTTLRRAQGESCPNDAYRSGAGALLPDCRAHELVSPLDKDGGDIALVGGTSAPTPGAAVLNQSSLDGNKLAYGSYRAFGDAASAPYTVSYIARRGAAGWESHGVDPQAGKLLQVEFEPQLRALSDDLCQGWLKTFYDPPLAEDAVAGYPNLYRFEDPLCGPPTYTPITTVKPAGIAGNRYRLELQGHSASGELVAFAALGSLAGSGSPAQAGCKSGGGGCRPALYVQGAEGGPRFACVLPGGGPSTSECSAGTSHGAVPPIGEGRKPNLRNALSEDGKRLYWTNSIGEGKVYLRENPTEPQSAQLHGSAAGKGDLRVEAEGTYGSGSTSISYSGATGTFTAGTPIEGPGIPAGATIAARTPSTLTISAPTTEAKTNVKVGSGPRTISNLSTASGAFAAGQRVRGTGVPVGATIESTGAGFLVLSDDLTKSAKEVALESFSECTEADKACTTPVSEGGEALSGTGRSRFWAAAADGSRALYTTSNAELGLERYEADLYEYEPDGDTTTLIAGKAGGLLGASEDARRAYFSSREALTGGEENGAGEVAEVGKPNLYFREVGESPRFIAQLGAEEANPGPRPPSSSTALAFEPLFHSARVSPDGLHAAFMSARPLTGYDSTDAASGEADAEVFLYDAGAGKLICASCNPSGARPAGAELGSGSQPLWAAARLHTEERSLYPGRTMAGDGSRLYFESQDALVARDTNSRLDVYQWEAPGAGSCTSGSPAYSPQNEGCVSLISSGQSERDSELIDVSPSGDDVFFATLSSLLASDPGLVDIYDARIQGGFPAPPPPTVECEGESCQSPAPAPRAPAPASLSFRGPGDLAAAGRCARPARRARALSRRARRLRRSAPRAARRSAHRARRLSANAKRCRARARAARRSQR